MKRFVVNISTVITVDAEDENEAPEIAVQLCDFGSFDYEVHTEEEWDRMNKRVWQNDDTLFLDGEYYPLKPEWHDNDVVSQHVFVIKEDDNG